MEWNLLENVHSAESEKTPVISSTPQPSGDTESPREAVKIQITNEIQVSETKN